MPEPFQMLRIVTHEHSPRKGGAGVVAEQLAMAVARRGRDVEVWAQDGAILPDEAVGASKYALHPVPKLRGTRNLPCLFRMVRAIHADASSFSDAIVHVAEPAAVEAFFYLQWFPWKPWKRLILTVHGSEIRRWRKNPVYRILFSRLAGASDRIHVLSNYNAKEILSWLPGLASRLFMAYGVPNAEVALHPREEGGDSANKRKVLLCVGRIHPRKGQLYLLQCINGLPRAYKERIEVRFVGQVVKDGYNAEVSRLASQCGCPVVFAGGVSSEDLMRAYARADLFAMTSVPVGDSVEGLGLVYLEASRHGLPVLANRTGGVEDAVLDGVTGLLSEVGDADGFRHNLMRLIDSQALCSGLGAAGRLHVAKHTWDDVAERLYHFDGPTRPTEALEVPNARV